MLDRYHAGLHGALRAGEATYTILGAKVQPLSLWHVKGLHEMACPLLTENATTEAEPDWLNPLWLWKIVRLLQQPARIPGEPMTRLARLKWQLSDRKLTKTIKRYGDAESDAFKAQCVVLGALIGECYEGPIFEDATSGGEAKLTWWLHAVCELQLLGISERRAWAMTPGLAMWYLMGRRIASQCEGTPILPESTWRSLSADEKALF